MAENDETYREAIGKVLRAMVLGAGSVPMGTRLGNPAAAFAAATGPREGQTPGQVYDQYANEWDSQVKEAASESPTAFQLGGAVGSDGLSRGALMFRGKPTIFSKPSENAKYVESGDQIFGIGFKSGPPETCQGGTCVGAGRRAGECGAGCYDLAQEKLYGYGPGRISKTEYFQSPEFLEEFRALTDHLRKKGQPMPWIRPGSPGGEPFFNDKAISQITEMAKIAPESKFGIFTKNGEALKQGKLDELLSLPNAGILQSRGGRFDDLYDPRLPIVTVRPQGTPQPPGSISAMDTLMPAFEAAVAKRPADIFLEAHGAQRGQFKKSSPPMVGGRRKDDPPADSANINMIPMRWRYQK